MMKDDGTGGAAEYEEAYNGLASNDQWPPE